MNTERLTVGYIRTLNGNRSDCAMQNHLIEKYASGHGLTVHELITDTRTSNNRNVNECRRAEKIGVTRPEGKLFLPALEEMLLRVMNNEIETIIVDRKERLYRTLEDKQILECITNEHRVRVEEINCISGFESSNTLKVAGYHYFIPNPYSDGIRTASLLKDIEAFYDEISTHPTWELSGLYIDENANKRTEFLRLMEHDDIDIIVCKHFYLLKRKTLKFLQIIEELNQKNVTVISTEEGVIYYDPQGSGFLKKSQRVATYECCSDHKGGASLPTRKKFDLFFKTIAGLWCEKGCFRDEVPVPGEEFERISQNADQFDMLVVESFTVFGSSVNELMRCVNRVGIPIYSLREGLLYVDRKKEISNSV